jgi:prevent-host-death family protein
MQVSVRELKSHLSQVLASAQDGEEVTVTSHKRVIARIVGVPQPPAVELPAAWTDAQRARVARLVQQGHLLWGGGKPRGGPAHTVIEGKTMADMVLEDRG